MLPCLYEFRIPPTLKTLDRVLNAFRVIEEGQGTRISGQTWKEFDDSIDWMINN